MKTQLQAFLKHFGYKANGLVEIVNDPEGGTQIDENKADLIAPIALPAPTAPTAPDEPDEPTAPGEPSKEDFGELVELNKLVKELGGVESFKALLVNAAAVVANHQSAEEAKKSELVKTIVANSGSSMTEEDLQSVPVPLLSKMADGMRSVQQNIHYGPMGAGNVQHNAEDMTPATRPRFLMPAPQEA